MIWTTAMFKRRLNAWKNEVIGKNLYRDFMEWWEKLPKEEQDKIDRGEA